jgi:hypothetical protein
LITILQIKKKALTTDVIKAIEDAKTDDIKGISI